MGRLSSGQTLNMGSDDQLTLTAGETTITVTTVFSDDLVGLDVTSEAPDSFDRGLVVSSSIFVPAER
jgi:hypothetical protein